MALFNSSLVSSAILKAAEVKKIPVKPTPYPVTITAYPSCCGARILSGFPSGKASRPRLELFLNNTLKSLPGYQLHCTLREGGQVNACEPLLLEKGFTKIAVFNNPNSGANIHSYVFAGRKAS